MNDNRVIIQTEKDLLIIDENGNETIRIKPYGNDCSVTACGLSTGNSLIYSTGIVQDTSSSFYVSKLDNSGNTVWHKYDNNFPGYGKAKHEY